MTALPNRSSRRWTYLPRFAQAQLPRYTSYPPANRFGADVDSQAAAAALGALPAQSRLSLYIHIPYCQKLCWYCGCHTSVPTRSDPVSSYLEAMHNEIQRIAARVPAGARVTHIHLGGGSPDILTPMQIAALFGVMRDSFDVSPFAEIAAELDPRNASAEVIDALAAAGLTRASLGVQVFDRTVQERINRIQTESDVALAITRLRDSGVASLNIDMMYGLPGQTTEHVIETALFAARQDADRVAVFGYAHVPWFKKHQKAIQVSALPEGEARFRQAETASKTLEQAGYIPIGFDHFAAPGDSLATADQSGRLRRNFQGYTDDNADALLGFGASAISSLPDMIYQNTPDTAAYRAALSSDGLAVVRGVRLTDSDRETGRLIERILCDFEADIPPGAQIRACPALSELADAGLVLWRNGRLVVTESGRPYVRNIAAAFDPDIQATLGRHSLAI